MWLSLLSLVAPMDDSLPARILGSRMPTTGRQLPDAVNSEMA